MPRFWHRVALAAAIHDLGKCVKAFQDMLQGGPAFHHRHEVFSAPFLRWLLPNDPEHDLPWAAAAVLTHHKDWKDIDQLYPRELLDDPVRPILTKDFLETAQALLVADIWPVLQESGLPLACSAPSAPLSFDPTSGLKEVLAAADGLVRRLHRQPYDSPEALAGRFLRGALIMSDHSGSAHVRFKMLTEFDSPELALSALGLEWEVLHAHQKNLSKAGGNTVLIAPTGSGKTEAAILWAAKKNPMPNGYPVLFYVLPYQASLNAMHARIEGHFGSGSAALQHSKAVQALYRNLLEDYSPARAAAIAREKKNLARLHTTPIRALTPYQLLRAAFQLKGHEAIWTDAAGGLVVFDEIHAYDPHRLGMILATLRHMTCNLGIRALVMSATLPQRLARILQAVLPDCATEKADADTYSAFRRHRIHTLDAGLLDDVIVDRIANDALLGIAVLAVATTVGRAQQLCARLRERVGTAVELLHGRFHADHRFDKERRLLRRRGPQAQSSDGPVVLVATQVVEVSLNVDFDVLYSDPAPLDALLQRFGRINRWRKAALRDVNVMCHTPDGCPVYEEGLINAALTELSTLDGQPLDEALVQELLDRIYAGERGDRWATRVNTSIDEFQTRVLASLKPFATDNRIEETFDELFNGVEVLPKCEEEKYKQRREEEPLLAPSLLVPVTQGQFMGMLKSGSLQKRHDVWVADKPYSESDGLQVNSPATQDGV
jgi:CRISPR-associated endonuclease/helicase Cas3